MSIIQTDRLIVSEFRLSDTGFILHLVNTPSWIKFIGDRNIHTKQEAEDYLTNGPLASYKKNGFGLYKLQLKANTEPIGMCGLLKRDDLDHPDIGFALLPDYEGYGFGLESSKAVLKHARQNLDIKQVLGITIKSNERSIHLLEKLGLVFSKTIRIHTDTEPLMLFSCKLDTD